MKKTIVLGLLLIILIAGCTQKTTQTLYVCSDETIVENPEDCPKVEEKQEEQVVISYSVNNEEILDRVEKEVLDLVNKKRDIYEIRRLLWNEAIAKMARDKSKDMATNDYFNHESPYGESLTDILKSNKIFYLIATEDIYMIGNITKEDDLFWEAENVVDGWLESPGHRVPIIDKDELYTDAGVGVYCRNDICYFTMQFIKLETRANTTLKTNYGTFIYIFDPSLEYDYNISVVLEVNSTKTTDTYIVEDSDQYDLFMQGYPIYSIREYKHTNYVNTTITAKRGYGIIIYSDPLWVFSDADIDVKIRYLN